MPDESAPHEGTWLQWPHQHTYGRTYRDRIESTWIEMTRELVNSERVHIVAWDAAAQARIVGLLTSNGIELDAVDFLLRRTNDCWVRDNGPLFVRDNAEGEGNALKILDWGFDGWGDDAPSALDDSVPAAIADALGIERLDRAKTVLEGGAIEIDGRGTLIATRSSILDAKRNPGLSEEELEQRLARNIGATKVIWLDGAPGGKADITDMHVDGFARFADPRTLVTMSAADLGYWGLSEADVATLAAADDVDGHEYRRLELPLTNQNVVTTWGLNLGYKGSYVNFYVGNTVVLVPTYADANDAVALALLQDLFEERVVVGIDCRNLYRFGGMVHCVTQQQPAN
ncbi:MAG: agmatine deiminase family protein [Myxococcales bacterium]|nr:agmatine deiminase family protein [Myxococcales bacterium]